MNLRNTLIISAVLILSGCVQNTELKSPSGDLSVAFSIDEHGIPHYSLEACGQDVIKTSSIGLEALEANLKD